MSKLEQSSSMMALIIELSKCAEPYPINYKTQRKATHDSIRGALLAILTQAYVDISILCPIIERSIDLSTRKVFHSSRSFTVSMNIVLYLWIHVCSRGVPQSRSWCEDCATVSMDNANHCIHGC